MSVQTGYAELLPQMLDRHVYLLCKLLGDGILDGQLLGQLPEHLNDGRLRQLIESDRIVRAGPGGQLLDAPLLAEPP